MKTIYGYSRDYNMGFIKRRKSGKIQTTKLVVPGQGVNSVKKPEGDKKSSK
jgi:hypothetical protein